jgi:hypothetical protein
VAAVGNAVSSGSAVGGGFIWVLVGIGLVMCAMAWLEYRRRSAEPSEP